MEQIQETTEVGGVTGSIYLAKKNMHKIFRWIKDELLRDKYYFQDKYLKPF